MRNYNINLHITYGFFDFLLVDVVVKPKGEWKEKKISSSSFSVLYFPSHIYHYIMKTTFAYHSNHLEYKKNAHRKHPFLYQRFKGITNKINCERTNENYIFFHESWREIISRLMQMCIVLISKSWKDTLKRRVESCLKFE